MKGHVLDFSIQSGSGAISGVDGGRYTFDGADWKGTGVPVRGMAVDFEANGSVAKSVYVAIGTQAPGSKSKVTAGVLALLVGSFGIHKFYLGFTGPGLLYLLVNTIGLAITWLLAFIPNIALGVMAFIEGIIYLTKSDEEFEQLYVVQKKRWF